MSAAEAGAGERLHALIAELYPICRSLTGDGVRRSLAILQRLVPLEVQEIPSGTQVFDWTVPPEWNIRDAWIKNLRGERVVDFQKHNLHVVSYSAPVRTRMRLEELRPRLHSYPDRPDWIPYRTSYYKEDWGFCLSQRQLESLRDPEYEVCIDSTLAPGKLTYGELHLPGESDKDFLLSAHICHPSLANDNLSGVAVAAFLARELLAQPPGARRRLGLRILWIPGTIGAIAWLARNAEAARRVRAGLTLVCVGDRSPLTYKKTVGGEAEIDRATQLVLRQSGRAHQAIDFFPYGYDERQFNSPGFRLPVGSLMRGRHGEFPEYHSSADNLDFVAPESLAESLALLRDVFAALDGNRAWRNLAPHGEPQLGKRGIYREMGDADKRFQLAMLWVLNLSDGDPRHDLLAIAERAGLPLGLLQSAAELLSRHGLLAELPAP